MQEVEVKRVIICSTNIRRCDMKETELETLKSKIYFRELEIDSLRKAIKTFEESNKLYKKVIKTLEKLLKGEK